MMSGVVTNLIFVRAQTGKAAKLEEALKELAHQARDETGILIYEVHRSVSDSDEYLLYGIWQSQADLEMHLKAPAIQTFLGKQPGLVNGAFNLRLFTPVDVDRI